MTKKVNQRQIRHLTVALIQSRYYSEEIEEEAKIDLKFVKALQLFFVDSKGKDVERVVNAFRTILPDFFSEIPGRNFLEAKTKLCISEFLMKNMESIKYKVAQEILFYNFKFDTGKIYKIHPQKV